MALTLEDKREIEELIIRYAFFIDSFSSPEDFYALFTDDAVLVSPFSGRFSGRRGLEAFVAYRATHPSWGPERTQQMRHIVCNVLIEGEGDTASMTAYLVDWNTHRFVPDSKSELLLLGHYECDAVRIDGRWKLKSRVLVVDTVSGGHNDNSDRDFDDVSSEQLKQATSSV